MAKQTKKSAKALFPHEEVEKRIGYTFQNKDLLLQAFTRSSHAQEQIAEESNEVQEFIGDSILGMLVVKRLTHRYSMITPFSPDRTEPITWNGRKIYIRDHFQCALDEGELSQYKSALVQTSSLSAATARLGLQEFLRMGKSDVMGNVQESPSVQEDLLEAIVGAVALDCGWQMDVLENLAERLLDLENLLERGLPEEEDDPERLQEWGAQNGFTPEFEEIPPRCKHLAHSVCVNLGMGMLSHIAYGHGATLEGARRMAATNAMRFIRRVQNRAQSVIAAVGVPNLDRAVNQLQELYQKNLIPEPKYTFKKEGLSDSGNPQWSCQCTVAGMQGPDGSMICSSKAEAKKYQAFEMVSLLVGIDFGALFLECGEKVSEKIEVIDSETKEENKDE